MSSFRTLAATLTCLVFLVTLTLMTQVYNYLSKPLSEHQDEIQNIAKTPAPDFASFTNAKAKKNAFFGYMLPMIRNSNKATLRQREQLQSIAKKFQNGKLKAYDIQLLNQLKTEYKIEDTATVKEALEFLLLRVDQVPESLALAQAAKESGWGTSRFAREANNYFGQWCYQEGCGLIPGRRPEGATHEVRKFTDTSGSVAAYIKNLNTHKAYEKLRTIRANLRQRNETSGLKLAEGLDKYSQRGHIYVEEIQSMIRFNKLEQPGPVNTN